VPSALREAIASERRRRPASPLSVRSQGVESKRSRGKRSAWRVIGIHWT
jgi:hypothetical protein